MFDKHSKAIYNFPMKIGLSPEVLFVFNDLILTPKSAAVNFLCFILENFRQENFYSGRNKLCFYDYNFVVWRKFFYGTNGNIGTVRHTFRGGGN